MTLNLTKLNKNRFNVLTKLRNILQKIVAGKIAVTKNPEFMPQNAEITETSRSFSIDKSQFETTEPENILTLPFF